MACSPNGRSAASRGRGCACSRRAWSRSIRCSRAPRFIDTYRILTRDHGFTRSGAFGICARVYRSGGLAKDAIYLQGFRAVIDFVVAGGRLEPFWLGKIAVGHVAAIEELLLRGLVTKPIFTPLFLDEADTKARIARLREAEAIDQLWQGVN